MTTNVPKTINPFDSAVPATAPQPSSALVAQESQRAIAEVQASIILAKQFPRDQRAAYERIMIACQRPSLAESALYSYSKGGTAVTGPSIRLAEAIAQSWGNLSFGIKELEQRNGESTVLAYAWDMETNTRQEKVFQVKHIRSTKKGTYALDDPREIYELTANQGARRLRACILGVIPGDVIDAAVDQCENTMKAKADVSTEGIKKLLAAFEPLGVTKTQIEARIQRNLDSITPAQVVGLKKIYASLRDGMSSVGDWFDMAAPEQAAANHPASRTEAAKQALKKNNPKHDPLPKSDTYHQSTSESVEEPSAQPADTTDLLQTVYGH